jgi:hypothetical protein
VTFHAVTLKPDDRAPEPAPVDPQAAGVDMMVLASAVADEAAHLHSLLAAWDTDPMAVRRRAQSRAHELSEMTARLRDACEAVTKSQRAAGVFSHAYADDLGVR